MNKKVLIACEESQAVCIEFRKLGIEAYSCDIQECSGGYPEWHIVGDAVKEAYSGKYDMMIGFPPCTDLAVSGARWFHEKRKDGRQQLSIDFFMSLINAPIKHIAIENPVGIMSSLYRKPNCIIQPWEHGHGETKKTCLWLKNLPNLIPTNIVDGREQRIWKLPPTSDRGKLRSKTFPGIAKALAIQYATFMDSGMSLNDWVKYDIFKKNRIFAEYVLLMNKDLSYAEKQQVRINTWNKIQ